MSSNRQCQTISFSRSEKCIVGIGLEHQAALDSRVSVIAEHRGKIIYTNTIYLILFIYFVLFYCSFFSLVPLELKRS